MAGIYFHIPYCRKACHYCDFHFSTSVASLPEMTEALLRELEMRNDLPASTSIETVYFGGGTPSLLPPAVVGQLIDAVRKKFRLDSEAEITLEANPDDLLVESLAAWKTSGITRLSIGIQSFQDADLRYMNRSHSAEDALAAVGRARAAGFRDLTVDLIYGTPTLDAQGWERNLRILAELELPHFSAYSLTVEPRTALASFVSKGTTSAPDDENAARQFDRLLEWSREHGYEQYEISNFAFPGRYSRHNTSYWKGIPYLGIGPSAHSFDGTRRSWNIRSNPEYLRGMRQGDRFFEAETLSPDEKYNETILTGLRTMWGIGHDTLRARFGDEALDHFLKNSVPFRENGWLVTDEVRTVLTDAGKLFADRIASALFR